MSTRYVFNAFSLVAGAFLAIVGLVFAAGALQWVGFGVALAVALVGVAGLARAESARHLAGFGALSAVATWTFVAALVFTGPALSWLVFAGGAAIGVLALTALAIHEVTTERVVHTLVVRNADHLQTV